MKNLIIITISFLIFSCQEKEKNVDMETLAFEGINIDFHFKSDKPTFGDLFLIVGFENPNSLPNSTEFEKLNQLGFTQIDDYFGIRNESDFGDDVKLWLFPIKNGIEVYHDNGPFDAIRINFGVLRNGIETSELLENVFNSFKQNLDVNISFNGKEIKDYAVIKKKLNETIDYCRNELKVEPGSEKALQFDY
jgi:hypothetical protein